MLPMSDYVIHDIMELREWCVINMWQRDFFRGVEIEKIYNFSFTHVMRI